MKKILFILPLFCLSSCFLWNIEPVEPSLPELTTNGANTFGCMVDGELFLPKSNNFLRPKLTTGLLNQETLGITAREVIDEDERVLHLSIPLNVAINDTNYWVKPQIESKVWAFYLDFDGDNEKWAYSGYYVISSLDTSASSDNRHVAGKFEFEGLDSLSGSSVSITEGRFDISL